MHSRRPSICGRRVRSFRPISASAMAATANAAPTTPVKKSRTARTPNMTLMMENGLRCWTQIFARSARWSSAALGFPKRAMVVKLGWAGLRAGLALRGELGVGDGGHRFEDLHLLEPDDRRAERFVGRAGAEPEL